MEVPGYLAPTRYFYRPYNFLSIINGWLYHLRVPKPSLSLASTTTQMGEALYEGYPKMVRANWQFRKNAFGPCQCLEWRQEQQQHSVGDACMMTSHPQHLLPVQPPGASSSTATADCLAWPLAGQGLSLQILFKTRPSGCQGYIWSSLPGY